MYTSLSLGPNCTPESGTMSSYFIFLNLIMQLFRKFKGYPFALSMLLIKETSLSNNSELEQIDSVAEVIFYEHGAIFHLWNTLGS